MRIILQDLGDNQPGRANKSNDKAVPGKSASGFVSGD
jgi:hypothetical protein